jgi:hypothetical protein
VFPPPPPTRRIADILAELNAASPGWIEATGYHSLATPKMTAPNIVDFNFPNSGIVMKVFINVISGELRMYVAKWLDIPQQDRIILWAND